jgi:hypothetical protein
LHARRDIAAGRSEGKGRHGSASAHRQQGSDEDRAAAEASSGVVSAHLC